MARWFEDKLNGGEYSSGSNYYRERRKMRVSYTGIIILINVFAFLAYLVLLNTYDPEAVISVTAIRPATILEGKALWTFVTSMFIHAGLGHLFVNMLSLLFIGSFVEKLIGKKRFLWLYMATGIFAGLFFIVIAALTGADLNVFAVGASGAIFGLGGLLAVLTPRLPVLVFFILPLPMWAAMIALIAILWILSLSLGLPIGNVAHLGGLLLGVGYGFYLRLKYPRRTKMISKYFSR